MRKPVASRQLTGRDRAVALRVDEHGAATAGLFARLEDLSVSYQAERADLETGDITAVVLKALLRQWQDRCANDANGADDANAPDRLVVTAKTICETALEILKDDESDLTAGDVTVQKIGQVLHKQRIKKLKRERNRGAHHWEITQAALEERGIAVAAEGGRLKVDAPAGAITPDLRQALAEHKPALLAHLGGANAGASAREELPTFPKSWQLYFYRIPLDDLDGFHARYHLRVVDGTAFPDGRAFRPTIYLADDAG